MEEKQPVSPVTHGRAFVVPEIKAIDEEARTVTHVISSDSVDRHGDIVEPGGADLKGFERNPVVFADHYYSVESIIGRAVDVVVDGGRLLATTKFHDEGLGRSAFNLIAKGMARAWSIGFKPKKGGYEAIRDEDKPERITGYRYTDWELLEYSLVGIPANPDTVNGLVTRGLVSSEDVARLFRYAEVAEPTSKNDAPVKAEAVVRQRDPEQCNDITSALSRREDVPAVSGRHGGMRMGKNILDAAKAAADKHDDPLEEAVRDIAKHTVLNDEAQTKRANEIAESVEDVKQDITKQTGKLDVKLEGMAKVMDQRLEALDKRHSITNHLAAGMYSNDDRLLAAVPESKRYMISMAESTIMARGKSEADTPINKNPILRTLTGLWWQNSTKLGSSKYSMEHVKLAEETSKIVARMNDVYGKAAYLEGSQTTPGTAGGLVPLPVAADILRIAVDSSVVYGRARRIPMTSNEMKIPNEATGVTVYWSAEADTLTGGEGTIGQNSLIAGKLIGRATLSREVVDDSIVGIVPYLQQVFGEKFGWELDQESLEGDGTNFTGLVTESNVNSLATDTTNGAALTYLDLVKVIYEAGEGSTRLGAAFITNPKIFATVVGLVDSDGQPIFQYANVPGSPQMTILGYPVYLTTAASVAITRGATPNTGNVYFGSPSGLVYGDRLDMRFEVTDQVGWATDSIDVRMMGRWGFTVGTPAAFTKLVGCTQLA